MRRHTIPALTVQTATKAFELTIASESQKTTSAQGISFGADIDMKTAHKRLSEFDVLCVPGGGSDVVLKNKSEPLQIVKAFSELQKVYSHFCREDDHPALNSIANHNSRKTRPLNEPSSLSAQLPFSSPLRVSSKVSQQPPIRTTMQLSKTLASKHKPPILSNLPRALVTRLMSSKSATSSTT